VKKLQLLGLNLEIQSILLHPNNFRIEMKRNLIAMIFGMSWAPGGKLMGGCCMSKQTGAKITLSVG
jgi:hypothetical protein